jgi:S1-C subfamily serine protease
MSNVLVDLSNSLAAATEKAGKSTVLVNARRRMPASGIAFAPDLILTANHVVEFDEDIKVTLPDGSEVPAKLSGRDPGSDLAVLRLDISTSSLAVAEVAAEARVGQFVLALGRPTTEGIEASLGVLSAINGPVHTPQGMLDRFYRTDTTPYPGFSGGPLVDAEGKILGLNTSGFGRGMAITIPSGLAWKVADQLAKHGSVKRGYLGIRSQQVEIPSAAQKALKREQVTGLLIIGVETESPAEKASLTVGDILVGFEGHPITDHDELFAYLAGDVVGKESAFEILRGGQPQLVKINVEERPSAPEEEEGHHHGHGRGHWHGHR